MKKLTVCHHWEKKFLFGWFYNVFLTPFTCDFTVDALKSMSCNVILLLFFLYRFPNRELWWTGQPLPAASIYASPPRQPHHRNHLQQRRVPAHREHCPGPSAQTGVSAPCAAVQWWETPSLSVSGFVAPLIKTIIWIHWAEMSHPVSWNVKK